MEKVCTIRFVAGRLSLAAVLLFLLLPSGGCRICADCEDLSYPAYGGAWQRTRRDSGRVGSLFDPAGAKSPSLEDRNMPEKSDVQERAKQLERGNGQSQYPSDDPQLLEEPQSDSDVQETRPTDDELRMRQLDEIEEKQEERLRGRRLQDLDVKVVPGEPMPPVLR